MYKICISRRCFKVFFAALLTCICFLFSGTVSAQQTVHGTIKDASDKPLSGATIAVKGGSQSTVSDAKGAFTISVPNNNSVLVISYIGYTTQEITVGASTSFD